MAVSGPNNPFGHPDAMVDQFIGSAYDKVKFVALHLVQILRVADALEGTLGTDPLLKQRSFSGQGKLGEIGSMNRFPLPAYIEPSSVLSISMRVQIGQSAFTFNDDRFFYVSIEDGQIVVILRNDAPIEFANASVRWFGICGT